MTLNWAVDKIIRIINKIRDTSIGYDFFLCIAIFIRHRKVELIYRNGRRVFVWVRLFVRVIAKKTFLRIFFL